MSIRSSRLWPSLEVKVSLPIDIDPSYRFLFGVGRSRLESGDMTGMWTGALHCYGSMLYNAIFIMRLTKEFVEYYIGACKETS